MSLFASLLPGLCWIAYGLLVPIVERHHASLSVIMSLQRRRWVASATRRESPLDAVLAGNLMQSVSLLASTTALIVLAIFAAFGQVAALDQALTGLGLSNHYDSGEMHFHLMVVLAIFVASFFSFTLSLRQFNHFCIMLGAIVRDASATEAEIDAIARINSMAAKNFNNGIRGYYFAVPAVAWFASDLLATAVTLVTVGYIIHRDFLSSAHRLAASVVVIANRREHHDD